MAAHSASPAAITLGGAAGAAFAEGPLEGNEVFNFQSTLSRADVQAQVAPAYKADQIARDYDEYELETESAGPVYQLVMRVAF